MKAWEINQVLAAAYHEAGHTVLARRHGISIREQGVWINAEGFGATHYQRLDPADVEIIKRQGSRRHWALFRCQLHAEVEIALAGWLAEARYHGVDALSERAVWLAAESAACSATVEHGNDVSVAAHVIAAFLRAEYGGGSAMPDAIVATYKAVKGDLDRSLRRPRVWQPIAAVASALARHRQLSAEEVERIVTAVPLARARPTRLRLPMSEGEGRRAPDAHFRQET